MTDAEKLTKAKATYATLCKALDKDEWHYEKDEEELSISCGARGEDLPIDLTVKVDTDRQLVILISQMSFKIKDDKRVEAALALTAINNMLVHGCFDYEISTGTIIFRLVSSFMDSVLGEEVFRYMLLCAVKTVDEYNDKLLMISTGMLSLEKFLEDLNKE